MIPEKVISPQRYRQLFLLANLLFIAVWYLSNQGLAFWDDFSYLNFANELNQGDFEIDENHFTSRITIIYPVAYVIKYLGISQYTMVVYPLICGLLLMNLFWWLGHRINRWIGVIGGGLVLCDYHLIYFSNHLFPEMPMALFVFVVLMSYYLVLKDEMVPRMAGLLAALALFAAFLTKTTVVLLLPLLLFLFINDRRRHRQGSFWLVFVSLSVFFFLLNGLWYMEVKGSFFYRFQNIANNHVATAKSFFDKDGLTLLARLTYLPLLGFLKGGFFIPLLLTVPAMLRLKRSHFRLEKPEQLWPVASLFLLLSFWFFSTSWRYYSPLPTEPRHIVFFIPVFLMTATTFWPNQAVFSRMKQKGLAVIVCLAFLAIPAYAILGAGKKNFKNVERLVEEYFVGNSSAQVVVADGLTSYGHSYFYDFEDIEDRYLWFSELPEAQLDELWRGEKPVYLLVNHAFFHADYEDEQNLKTFKEKLQKLGGSLGSPEAVDGPVKLYRLK